MKFAYDQIYASLDSIVDTVKDLWRKDIDRQTQGLLAWQVSEQRIMKCGDRRLKGVRNCLALMDFEKVYFCAIWCFFCVRERQYGRPLPRMGQPSNWYKILDMPEEYIEKHGLQMILALLDIREPGTVCISYFHKKTDKGKAVFFKDYNAVEREFDPGYLLSNLYRQICEPWPAVLSDLDVRPLSEWLPGRVRYLQHLRRRRLIDNGCDSDEQNYYFNILFENQVNPYDKYTDAVLSLARDKGGELGKLRRKAFFSQHLKSTGYLNVESYKKYFSRRYASEDFDRIALNETVCGKSASDSALDTTAGDGSLSIIAENEPATGDASSSESCPTTIPDIEPLSHESLWGVTASENLLAVPRSTSSGPVETSATLLGNDDVKICGLSM